MGCPRLILPALAVLVLLAAPARCEIAYSVEISGAPDSAVQADLHDVSQLVSLEDHPPLSENALRQRAEADKDRLEQALNAGGYWSARVAIPIDFSRRPAAVTIKVTAGPLYHLAHIAFLRPDGRPDPFLERREPDVFGLKPGGTAGSADILGAEPRIVAEYGLWGRPFAKVTGRRVVVDDGTRSVDVTYTVEPGHEAAFGPVSIQGLRHLDPAYVENRIAWQRGAPYASTAIEETRKALLDKGLFSQIRITPIDQPGADRQIPITIALTERARHSVGIGASYNTSLGFGTRAYWENRNLFGGAENLRVTGDFAESRLGLLAEFRNPDFLARNQDFVVTAELASDAPPAYTSRRERLFIGIERQAGWLLFGGGPQVEHAIARELARSLSFHDTLAGLPLYFRYDSTNDLLNPTAGDRAAATVAPDHGIAGKPLDFVSARLSGSHYETLGERVVLAGLLALGSVAGVARDALPVDKRLFAGGGGSLRGYGYQMAGPLGPGNKPLGGRSSIELSAELRIRLTDTVGIVPFIDAGNVYEKPLPDPGRKILYDAGIGARYYTAIGPVRLDVATPLSRRAGDGSFQIYVSLGQAF